jgi:hypothetical protein
MRAHSLTDNEKTEIAAHGLDLTDVKRQLEFYADPPAFAALLRPCTSGDGLTVVTEADQTRLAALFDDAVSTREVVKFVPASGAASRMFKTPLSYLYAAAPVRRDEVAGAAAEGDAAAAELLKLLDGLENFAFFDQLKSSMADAGLDVLTVARDGDVRALLEHLLTDTGMGYGELPKALLKFHGYGDINRTAFEEHLVEAAEYARGEGDVCRLHFTVSPEHRAGFEALLAEVRGRYEEQFGVRYEVDFSIQKSSTDVLAVELDGKPFRERTGELLFRPGGHGALIENLAEIDADVVFIKNIDNVVPDDAKGPTYLWKKVLGGLALELQSEVFVHYRAIESNTHDTAVEVALSFLADRLYTPVPEGLTSEDDKRAFAQRMLDRPIRACGMVPNTGEPGGGPFWVSTRGRESVQVVETSEVDPASDTQRALLAKSTHFNPVDLVCVFRRADGSARRLRDHVDRDAVFLVEKSKEGRPLLSLERPGLWNGAMSDWNTVFVEVPIETFAPVKTVDALLDETHQPARV